MVGTALLFSFVDIGIELVMRLRQGMENNGTYGTRYNGWVWNHEKYLLIARIMGR